jgi:hypothetical protein
MEYSLVDGCSAPGSGDLVRVRVLRGTDGVLAVDRPNRDHPLEIKTANDISVPEESATYEIRGEVNRVMLAERGEDFLFLNDADVVKVADELIELPRESGEPDWKENDATDADVSVDVGSVLDEETVVEESDARPSSPVADPDSVTENLNELLLDK